MIKKEFFNRLQRRFYFKAVAGITAVALLCGCSKNADNPSTGVPSSHEASVDTSLESSSQGSSENHSQESSQNASQAASEASTADGSSIPRNFYTVDSSYGVYHAGPYTVADPDNKRGLATELLGFGFGISQNGVTSQAAINNQKRFDSLGVQALAVDLKSPEKTLYLTFDCGYEYQDNSTLILNTLKEKNVKAAFFCTYPYVTEQPAKVQRMIDEGHIIGNHSTTHPNFPDISRIQMAQELYGVYEVLDKNFHYETKYFRFPAGRNSDSSLDLVASQGYRAVFWSVAYADYDPSNPIGADAAFNIVTSRTHPGAVILLHEVSPDNVQMLARYIDWAHENGYVFKTLDEYYSIK